MNSPASGGTWVNGATNPITWTKGLLDDVSVFDIELSTMSSNGLIYVARSGAYRLFIGKDGHMGGRGLPWCICVPLR